MGIYSCISISVGLSSDLEGDTETGMADLTGKVVIVTGGNAGIGIMTVQELYKEGAKTATSIVGQMAMEPLEGAKTQLYLVASPEAEEKTHRGHYFNPIVTPATPSAYVQDRELVEQLWKSSEEVVKNDVPA